MPERDPMGRKVEWERSGPGEKGQRASYFGRRKNMNFVEDLRLLHVDAKEIPCLTGKGCPTEKTEGAPGVLYMDLDTGELYKCRGGTKGQYRWELQRGSGEKPVKGVDYFTPADKAELAGMVLEVLQGKVISGYVAEDGSIVINGLPDGNYTVKYEMADGSTLEIGELVLDTRVHYSVTGNLSNCVSSNSAVSVAQGDSYKTTITAVSGYALESVTVTMGGVDITAQAVSGGSISIAGVTGDVVITAVAVSAGPGYTNLAQPDPNATGEAAWNAGGWCNGSYIAGSSYAYRQSTDMTRVTTNVFAVGAGDTIYVKGIKCTDGTDAQIALLNADSGRIYNSTVTITANNSYISQVSYIDGYDYWSFRNSGGTGADHGTRFIRLAGYLSGGVNDIIITRNQPIE